MNKRVRAALESAPETAAASPSVSASVIAELAAAERAAQARGDHAAHAALSELHVAAGLLRAKAATRAQELSGADRELAEKVHSLL